MAVNGVDADPTWLRRAQTPYPLELHGVASHLRGENSFKLLHMKVEWFPLETLGKMILTGCIEILGMQLAGMDK